MESTRLYNTILLATYMDLLEAKYPLVNVDKLLEYAKIARYELEDRGHWLTQEQVDRFYEFLVKNTGNHQIAREAGRFVVESKSSSLLRQYTAGFVTPSMAYWTLGKIASTLSRHVIIEANHIAANKVEFAATLREGIQEKLYQCENRVGLCEGLAKLFTGEYAQVEHNECIHKGDPSCKYIVTWKTTPEINCRLLVRPGRCRSVNPVLFCTRQTMACFCFNYCPVLNRHFFNIGNAGKQRFKKINGKSTEYRRPVNETVRYPIQ
jgi:predicted hydrocarbon binding protein